jgi:UDP-N-acetylglucosamine 1-carboxyvinyltransferase
MLRAQGTSELRHVDVIHRGYEQLAQRLQLLGAEIEPF